ncbi:alpha/beta fold hydrolase [Halosimplex aquaticum]|uniref:Alpha/beta fold hydrolase n=1 Tax=Halosimplex aquaticum TaxID=3026162 RepID=A0ABD5Y9J4_9EURY|nr:alpha/beta fold hydrolase [Halosimplex aquaticum]
MTATDASDGRLRGAATPDWLDRSRYPFEPDRLSLPAGEISYVDEGEGPTLLFVHGNPTWSFLYRHLISGLSDEYRCVAPDLPGFGLSDDPAAFSYRPPALARTLRRFVDRLSLRDCALVLHDWGGPLGMDFATRRPEEVTGVVAMNTWCWPRERAFDRLSSAVTHTRLARWLYLRHNVFARAAVAPLVFSAAVSGRFDLAAARYRHYAAPLADPESRRATWVLSGAVGRARAWLSRIWRRRHALGETPIRLVWGGRDPIHGSFVRRWRTGFERTDATVLDGVGHFVPEELGTALVEPVRRFAGVGR